MRIDLSVGIGVNGVDADAHPSPFNVTLPVLTYAENSARRLASIAGAPPPQLLGATATTDAVSQAILAVAGTSAGKTVLISFSGHGLQLTDAAGAATGGVVDCWCLYDAPLRDDEILALLEPFDATATVLLVSDCCYGGGIVDSRESQTANERIKATVVAIAGAGPNAPAFAASQEHVSALVAALEKELAPVAPPPASYSELQTRLQSDLWKAMMRQIPSVRRFGRAGSLDDVVPFWTAPPAPS